jgi:hypothetical protein
MGCSEWIAHWESFWIGVGAGAVITGFVAWVFAQI